MQNVLLHVDDDMGLRNAFADIVRDFIDPNIRIETAADVQSGIEQFRRLYAQSGAGEILFIGTILDFYLDKDGTTTTAPVYAEILKTDAQFASRVAVWSGSNEKDIARVFAQEQVACPLNILKKTDLRPLVAFIKEHITSLNP